MKIVFYKKEKTLTELAKRLYKTTDRNQKRVEAELLKQNPQLSRLTELREGAVIVVPDVPNTTVEKGEHPLSPVAGDLSAKLQEVLRRAETALREGVTSEADASRGMIELLKDRELKNLTKADRQMKDAFDRVRNDSRDQGKALDQLGASQKSGLAQLQKDLKQFSKLLEAGG